MELLLLMSNSDVKGLKNEFANKVNLSELLQLINLLKQIPQSQIYQDTNKDKMLIYLSPKQHKTITSIFASSILDI